MAEQVIRNIKDEPRAKMDLVYDPEGWNTRKMGEKPSGMFIIRTWVMDGLNNPTVRNVKMTVEEFSNLCNALPACAECGAIMTPNATSLMCVVCGADPAGS